MAAPTKDIAGKKLAVGDTILVPAMVPAKITAIGENGASLNVQTERPIFPGSQDKSLLTVVPDQCAKWTQPGD